METRQIYLRVLTIVEYFLKNAAHLSIQQLQNYDPSLEQLADDLGTLAAIMQALSGCYEDENMAINAIQCCHEMRRLAKAVRAENEGELEAIFKNLEMHARVPWLFNYNRRETMNEIEKKRLIKEANKLLDRIESTIHSIVSDIKSKSHSKAAWFDYKNNKKIIELSGFMLLC